MTVFDGCRDVATLSFVVAGQLGTSCRSHVHQQRNDTSPTLDTMARCSVKDCHRQHCINDVVLTADVLLSHLYDRLCWTTGKPVLTVVIPYYSYDLYLHWINIKTVGIFGVGYLSPLHLLAYSPNVVNLLVRPNFPTALCTQLYLSPSLCHTRPRKFWAKFSPKLFNFGTPYLQNRDYFFFYGTHHQECVPPDIDISLQSGWFWAASVASFRERLLDFGSCWIVFIHIVCICKYCTASALRRWRFLTPRSGCLDSA